MIFFQRRLYVLQYIGHKVQLFQLNALTSLQRIYLFCRRDLFLYRIFLPIYIHVFTLQFHDFSSMKNSSETLQNLSYFWNKKTQIVFCLFFISSYFRLIQQMSLVYFDIDQDCCKSKKNYYLFSYSKNMANFEIFHWNFSSSKNYEIVRCVLKAYCLC